MTGDRGYMRRNLWGIPLFPMIPDGCVMPWWAGVAYYRYDVRMAQMAPIGISKLWSWARHIYWELKKPAPPKSREYDMYQKMRSMEDENMVLRERIDFVETSNATLKQLLTGEVDITEEGYNERR